MGDLQTKTLPVTEAKKRKADIRFRLLMPSLISKMPSVKGLQQNPTQ